VGIKVKRCDLHGKTGIECGCHVHYMLNYLIEPTTMGMFYGNILGIPTKVVYNYASTIKELTMMYASNILDLSGETDWMETLIPSCFFC
jgi:hypothetical protein